MSRMRGFYLVPMLVVLLAGFSGGRNALAQYAPGGATVKGTVKSLDGKPMEGVTVSVRGEGKTFVTTVFTNQQGTYVFPRLEKNKYKLWAQAVGFEAARAEVDVTGSQPQQAEALELKPLQDFHRQMSANEWLASIPENDPKDVRMKAILVNNCTGCHQAGWVLQSRLDSTGWAQMIQFMSTYSSEGWTPPTSKPNPVMVAYKEELAGWLAKVRGPGSTLVPKLLPRPTGEAAAVVITEYDLPRTEVPSSLLKHDGSDWSEGTPGRFAGRAAHDVALDSEGNIYWADDIVPGRTFGKLDPKTGKVTDLKFIGPKDFADGTHSLITSPTTGVIWADDRQTWNFISYDPKTGKWRDWPRPDGMQRVGGTVAVDSKGNPWAETENGAIKLDVATGKHTYYKAIHEGINYGITVDAEDKAWIAYPGIDTLQVVDQSGKVSEVVLPPLNPSFGTDRDRDLVKTTKMYQNNSGPLQKGPRRLAADVKGNYVWVAEFFADQIARIDIHTMQVKEYPMPQRWSQPYAVNVDKNHMVWINMMDQDRIAKFDPTTEKFTEYQMPTRGTEIRHILADNSTDPPTIWAPYDRVNKIARVQFRKMTDMQ